MKIKSGVVRRKVILIILLSMFVLRVSSQNWNSLEKLNFTDRSSEDRFGYGVGIGGDYAIVGALKEDYDSFGNNYLSDAGAAYVYKKDTLGNWVQEAKLVASDRQAGDNFGYTVSISGGYAVVSSFLNDYDA